MCIPQCPNYLSLHYSGSSCWNWGPTTEFLFYLHQHSSLTVVVIALGDTVYSGQSTSYKTAARWIRRGIFSVFIKG
jgi:hypothetical protein